MENAARLSFYFFMIFSAVAFSQNQNIVYINPLPGSAYVNSQTNIIIHTNEFLDLSSLKQEVLNVVGSASGRHEGKITASGSKTILFQPNSPFSMAETVWVDLYKGLKNLNGKDIGETSFYFVIEAQKIFRDPMQSLTDEINEAEENMKYDLLVNRTDNDSLPVDFPQLTLLYNNDPAAGSLFLSNLGTGQAPTAPYLMILDNSLEPGYYKKMPRACFDFKKQPNGNLTYYNSNTNKFYETNPAYVIIDSFYCGNGYSTDTHELRLLSNGHALLMSYDVQIIDMRPIVTGGDSAAKVIGLVVQEIDENKNVVFLWRSWDHFQITDATHENLLGHEIDYVHGNAIELDNDGNLLISCRHMDEITKINRSNGNIIWRMGGENNQFVINDPVPFSHQHAIRRIANGNITLFDNGNYRTPHYSRAVEYSINEQTKTANLLWQYRHTPDVYGNAFGYVQRLPNGNTLISWGAANPTCTEVHSNGTKTFEMTLPSFVYSYRVYRFDWTGVTGLQENHNVPHAYSLFQNYPNPFNPSTVIKFNLPSAGYVKLNIFDMLGREVKTLLAKDMEAGSYEYNVNGSNLSSGVYFYRIEVTGSKGETVFADTKRMILVK